MKTVHALAPRPRNQGGILITTVLLIALMSMLTAATLYRVSSRHASTYQSLCWNEALASAEAGADLALVTLNKSLTSSATAWIGWTPNDATTFPKTYVPTIASHLGEGNTKVYTKIVIDSAVGGGWMRVRATGVAELPGRSVNGLEAAITDINGTKNHRNALRKPRFTNDITGGLLRLPQVARTVEVLAAPAANYPYMRPLTVKGAITMTGNAWTDSFDSTNPLYSTNTQYDFAKHLSRGDIASNSNGSLSDLNNSLVYGNAASNGGQILDTANVKGVVTNNFQTTIGEISDPTNWSSIEMTPTIINNPSSNITLVGGTAANPKNYKLNQISMGGSNGIVIAPPAPGVESYVNIWVTGKVSLTGNSYILQQPGVHVTFYGDDDMKFNGNGYMNQNSVASTLQVFGVTPNGGASRTLQVGGNGDFIGVLNAPAYDITINGNGQFVGTAIGSTATIIGGGGFHYDEALGSLPAPGIPKFQFVSWIEDIR